MKSNELNRAKEVDNQSLHSTVARFGDVIKNNELMENELKAAETSVSLCNVDSEVDLDVTAFGCQDDDQAHGLSQNESKDLDEDRISERNPSEVVEEVDVIDVGFNDYPCDQISGSQLSMVDHDKLGKINSKTYNERLFQLQFETLDKETKSEAHGVEKESPTVETNLWHDQLLNGNGEDDDYNRFYFESDHLALKDNKHYHLLLQTLLVLESQRSQAVKDLDNLYEQQVKALQDPVSFVEKLQNKEHLDLPPRQKIVKLPPVPWEEYTVSLSAIERQRLSNPHLTRANANNVGKATESSLQSSDASETSSTAPSESNVYSVFGGGFVASRQGKPLERESLTSAFTPRGGDLKNGQSDMKPVTFNQPWTTEEQAKLEKLLQIYPQEEIESKRWEKIAAALGNRTYKQVASRVQKYFIKLAKAGLPVPGRVPNIPRLGARSKRSSHHYQTLGFRNSTFFPSYRPKVLMDEDDEISSVATDDTTGYPSDEETVPVDQRNTEEYRELVELKRLKRQKLTEYQQSEIAVQHHGFMCDGCGMNPISGTRWHCTDCSKDVSVDLCTECAESPVTVAKPDTTTTPKSMPSSSSNFNVSQLIRDLLDGYDKRLRPNFGGPPVNVSATVFIEFIGDIDEINMEFTTIMYFRQYWKDERLKYNHKGYKKRLAFNPEMLKFIWVPDTHFPGIKDGLKHDITDTNEVVRLWPDGAVLYSMRLKITSQCPMNLINFPMDKQKCYLNIEAFSYDDQELILQWYHKNPVTVSDKIQIPSYTLTSYDHYSDTEEFSTGTYSLLTIQFDLTRRLGFHMIQIYLPCYLIVVLAWVSFWVDREQTAARIAMGITTVLTMATLIGSARTSLPKVSYVKSLEWFLMMCFLFVFSAILEYAFVSYLVFKQREEERNRVAMRKKHDEDKASEAAEVLVDNDKTPPSPGSRPSSGQEAVWIPGKSQVETVTRPGKCRGSKKPPSEDHYVRILNTVEFFSRLLFPVVFIFLNIAYWLYYGGIL